MGTTVTGQDEREVGRAFSNAAVELALAGYAGFRTTTPPTAASAFGVYWPAVIPATVVTQQVHLPDGETQAVRHTSDLSHPAPAPVPRAQPAVSAAWPGPFRDGPLGRLW